ncbi:MAG: glycosyltransferase [Kiritimatiellae bacterium]|nr:glycosyltransferase [Kiritimatiellia bacterium]
MARPADITVYVPYYNARGTIGECIGALRRQTAAPARILIVDDGSDTPPPREPGVEVRRHRTNRGLAAARNTALKACSTKLIASVDSDVVAKPDWLARLRAALAGRNVAGVGGRMTERHQDTVADRWRGVHMAQHWGGKPVDNPRFLYGANTLFKADALRAVGGYDERHRTNDEDRTLCDKLYAARYRLRYAPGARCEHLRTDTAKTVLPGYWQWHHTKGVLAGEFDAPDGLIARIETVNFGIGRYRFDMDRKAERTEFLGLDLAIPWVFCAKDLTLFHRRTNRPVPAFPPASVAAALPVPVGAALLRLTTPAPAPAEDEPWFASYLSEFRRVMDRSGWTAAARTLPQAALAAVAATQEELPSKRREETRKEDGQRG